MSSHSSLMLSVRHDSWIRQQIRDLVLHLDAPVETAELLQVGLISLSHSAVHRELPASRSPQAGEEAWVSEVRRRVKEDLIDEVRQMTHLSRLQRRHWLLVKLARLHLMRRLQQLGQDREPSSEEISVLTGLSVTEVEVLHRLARIGPWEPEQGSQQLMELRSLKPNLPSQLLQVRLETRAVMQKVVELLAQCPRDRLLMLHRHFGLVCLMDGRPLVPEASAAPAPRWASGLLQGLTRQLTQWLMVAGLDRRPQSSVDPAPIPAHALEELWPQKLAQLLNPPAPSGRPGQRVFQRP